MTQTKYQREWYIRNRDRILSALSIKTQQLQEKKKQTRICPICKNKFISVRVDVKYCGSSKCKKQASHNRQAKFKEGNEEYLQDYHRNYNMVNKELRKLNGRKGHLKRKYGITPDDYARMLDEQNGRCAICGDVSNDLHVDHDHATKKVRSLLCFHCNAGLGHFKDNPDLFSSAIKYLKKHKIKSTSVV